MLFNEFAFSYEMIQKETKIMDKRYIEVFEHIFLTSIYFLSICRIPLLLLKKIEKLQKFFRNSHIINIHKEIVGIFVSFDSKMIRNQVQRDLILYH